MHFIHLLLVEHVLVLQAVVVLVNKVLHLLVRLLLGLSLGHDLLLLVKLLSALVVLVLVPSCVCVVNQVLVCHWGLSQVFVVEGLLVVVRVDHCHISVIEQSNNLILSEKELDHALPLFLA